MWRAQQQVEKADENDAFKLHLISGIPVKRIRQILHQKYYQQFAASQDKGMVNSYHAEMIRISHSKIVRKVVEDCELVAALALEKQLSHANPQVVFNAATAILDRGGSLERHQNIIVEHRISEDQLERAREIARQLRPKKVEALPPGDVLEGEVVNVEPTRNSG